MWKEIKEKDKLVTLPCERCEKDTVHAIFERERDEKKFRITVFDETTTYSECKTQAEQISCLIAHKKLYCPACGGYNYELNSISLQHS